MGRSQPIKYKNRTRLVFKFILKNWKSKRFFFAFFSDFYHTPLFHHLKWLLKSLRSHQLALSSIKKSAAVSPITIYNRQRTFSPAFKGWSADPLLAAVINRISRQLRLNDEVEIKLPSIKLPHAFWKKFALANLLLIVGAGYGFYLYFLNDLPAPEELAQNNQVITTRILSRDGELLYRIYEDENRTLVALTDIPQVTIDATLAIEDKNFFYHRGFSLSGIIRAAIANSKDQSYQQGGSTITQQLVKNRLLTSEKTVRRKIRELVLSFLVERTYSKEQILEMYLNQVAYGGATYGIEEAAQRYFGKHASDLNLAESSLLAGLPVAPSVYSPFGPTPEISKQRQYEVLRRMVEDGYISQLQAEEAFAEELKFQNDVINIKAPHFVMYVKKILAEQYGEETVNQGGLEVRTTLDLSLQNQAQQIVTDEVEKLTPLRVQNGAAVVTTPDTGEVLAMVGSKNYFDFSNDGQVNVALRPRQPGSSIKPLTYAIALENGKHPSTIIEDSPVTYLAAGSPPYSPKNYDGKFHGKVTLREALASSYNVPAVKLLAEIGVGNMIDKAHLMGIDTWEDRRRFGLSLTLGGGEVTMLDMAEMYSTFANLGRTVELNPILEVKNYQGETLYRNTCALDGVGCPSTDSLQPEVAYQITNILADNKARTPAFGEQSVLHIPGQQVAVKTGTTNNLRDNWTIGFTQDHLVTTWVGNNDNTSMSYVASGITGASPIWNKIMRLTLNPEQPHQFSVPANLIPVKICEATGTLPCAGCPKVTEELFAIGNLPTKQCHSSWFTEEQKENSDQPLPHRDQILEGFMIR